MQNIFMICLNFNPIIGLILTHRMTVKEVTKAEFQSHYRSDFNFCTPECVDAIIDISIPL